MLGNMNYLAFRYKNMPINYEDFDPHDVYEATGNINRTPQKTLGWEYSIDKLKKALCD